MTRRHAPHDPPLVPRYLRLTGSTVTTVVLGGVTYTLLYCFDGWLAFTTPLP